MADQELSVAPVQGLEDGGHFLTMQTEGGSVTVTVLPVPDVAASLAKADTALQAADVGPMAYEETSSFVAATDLDGIVAAQNALLASMQIQIDTLTLIVGSSAIAVFELDIFEPGVFA